MTHGSLFSGIDGFSLAAEWMGWENKFHCEINSILLKFLEKKYPDAKSHSDITTTDFTLYRGKIDILTGGFPCQPFSVAGERKGTDDDRHLWPQMLRAIREIQPTWVVGENVRGLISWNGGMVFEQVLADLEAEGYEITPFLLPACAINAPHRRDRILFIAYSVSNRSKRRGSIGNRKEKAKTVRADLRFKTTRLSLFRTITNSQKTYQQWNRLRKKQQKRKIRRCDTERTWFAEFPTQSPICTGNDGVSTGLLQRIIRDNTHGLLTEKEELDLVQKTISRTRKEIIQAGGNAVVPPLILQIFKAIEELELKGKQWK